MNNTEAEFLGKKLYAFVIQIEMSSFLFPSGMHHSSLLSPHYNNLESVPAHFTWLRCLPC